MLVVYLVVNKVIIDFLNKTIPGEGAKKQPGVGKKILPPPPAKILNTRLNQCQQILGFLFNKSNTLTVLKQTKCIY